MPFLALHDTLAELSECRRNLTLFETLDLTSYGPEDPHLQHAERL